MKFLIQTVGFNKKGIKGDVTLSTDSNLEENLNHYTLVIGNNGCGKTSMINAIASYYSPSKYKYFPFTEIVSNGKPDRVIVTTNGIGDTFPNDLSSKEGYKNLYYYYLGTRYYGSYSKKYLLERAALLFLESKKSLPRLKVNRSICDFIGYDSNIQLKYSFNLGKVFKNTKKGIQKYIDSLIDKEIDGDLINEISKILPNLNDNDIRLYVDFATGNVDVSGPIRDLDIIRSLKGSKIIQLKQTYISKQTHHNLLNFDNVSSGEANLLTSLLALNSIITNNSLVLIDEPEISLHPDWQVKYMSKIQSIVELCYGCHVIIASHSHFLVSDLNPKNSTLVILNKDYNEFDDYCSITSKTPNASTYAWSAEHILMDVFKVPSTRNFYFASIVQEALELLGDHNRDIEKLEKLKEQIAEVLPNLKENDPLKLISESIVDSYV